MTPELEEHRKMAEEALLKAQELFAPMHPFVAMMVLSNVIAHWVMDHPTEDQARVWAALHLTTMEDIKAMQAVDEETVH